MAYSLRGFEHEDWEQADIWWDSRADRIATGGGEGVAFGLLVEQSPATLVPDWVLPGTLILAPTLARITEDYGRDVALMVDDLSGPCLSCARNTYLADICFDCQERIDALAHNIEPAVALERAGTFNPRED